ncbi:hypothetical protein KAW48_11520 [candidate division WOR-3 bacterium]|nr:hypothetical protein [candidate division WOR-3 bacterium]
MQFLLIFCHPIDKYLKNVIFLSPDGQMNAEGHKERAEEIKKSLEKLLPDEKGAHVVAIVELSYGIMQHLIAFGMERKYGRHLDTHVGLCRELRSIDEERVAGVFEAMDTFRVGRWYGGKGNGEIVKKCLEYISEVEEWVK